MKKTTSIPCGSSRSRGSSLTPLTATFTRLQHATKEITTVTAKIVPRQSELGSSSLCSRTEMSTQSTPHRSTAEGAKNSVQQANSTPTLSSVTEWASSRGTIHVPEHDPPTSKSSNLPRFPNLPLLRKYHSKNDIANPSSLVQLSKSGRLPRNLHPSLSSMVRYTPTSPNPPLLPPHGPRIYLCRWR